MSRIPISRDGDVIRCELEERSSGLRPLAGEPRLVRVVHFVPSAVLRVSGLKRVYANGDENPLHTEIQFATQSIKRNLDGVSFGEPPTAHLVHDSIVLEDVDPDMVARCIWDW